MVLQDIKILLNGDSLKGIMYGMSALQGVYYANKLLFLMRLL